MRTCVVRPEALRLADGWLSGHPRVREARLDRMETPAVIEVHHEPDRDDDPSAFHMLLTFDEQTDGRTIVSLRQMPPSKDQREAFIGFGASDSGDQTLDKLADHVKAGVR